MSEKETAVIYLNKYQKAQLCDNIYVDYAKIELIN